MLRFLLTIALLTAGTAPALARSNSIVTLGVGTGLGMLRSAQPDGGVQTSMLSNVNTRLKLLRFLGVDLTYSYVSQDDSAEELQFGARLRATALIFLIPTKRFGLYVGAGVGAKSFKELASIKAASNSYHIGTGVEVHVTDHITLDASFFMVVPGYASIERDIERRALSEWDDTPDSFEDLESLRAQTADLQVTDYISPKNFEMVIRGMFYF